MDHKCSKFQDETSTLQEKVYHAEAFHGEAKLHGSPSFLVTQNNELDSSLEVEKKHYYETSNVVTKENRRAKEDQKDLQQENESRAKNQRAHNYQVVNLKDKVQESLHLTLKNMNESLDQVVNQIEDLRLDVTIPCMELDQLKVIRDEASGNNQGAMSQSGEAQSSFIYFFFYNVSWAFMLF